MSVRIFTKLNARVASVPGAPVLLTRQEAAQILMVSDRTVDRLISDGKLRATRVGRAVRILLSEVERLARGEVIANNADQAG